MGSNPTSRTTNKDNDERITIVNIEDLRVGQLVRGVFLEDEPVYIDGTKNERFGQAVPFEGRVKLVDQITFGGPYITVVSTTENTIFLCDLSEILEVLDPGPWKV